jgi:hypothetical protein
MLLNENKHNRQMCEMKIGIAGEGTERKCAYTENTQKSGSFLPTSLKLYFPNVCKAS